MYTPFPYMYTPYFPTYTPPQIRLVREKIAENPIDPLLAVHEPAVTRTKGRPNDPTELPTRAELAFQRSTRRLPSEFERVEEYLSQRSNNTPVSTRGSRSRGRARGSDLADDHDPLITANQMTNEEETTALDAFYATTTV